MYALPRRAVACLAVLATASAGLAAHAGTASGASSTVRHIAYADWSTNAEFARGTHRGTRAERGALVLARPVGTRLYRDPHRSRPARRYEFARWVSPRRPVGFGLTELIPSWTAKTGSNTWIEVAVRGTTLNGDRSKWYVMGRWSAGERTMLRTSARRQADTIGSVAVDTFRTARGRRLKDWQVRVTLLRPVGSSLTPRVRSVGAVASRVPSTPVDRASALGGAQGTVLRVPTYSQFKHAGHYERWGGGGEAWCSPTSMSMVLRYWKSGPKPAAYSWVEPKVDPWVDHAARGTFDYAYDGAGNWPFNTAYAGRYGMNAFVTRLRSLREAEQFIKRGIPLIVSLSFDRSDLDGAGYSTNGHLMVIVGFDRRGNVVANDPAAHLRPRNDQVRVTYKRRQFENAWLPHSGGLTYVVHPPSVKLPPAPRQANW